MPATGAAITGQVFNGTSSFNGDTFLFASEAGTINGWRGALGTNAESISTVPGAVYKGLAISTAKDVLFAANFGNGAVDVSPAPLRSERILQRSERAGRLCAVQRPEPRRDDLRDVCQERSDRRRR